ncbi:MAG: iron-sulfur cluster assembly accessory protein [Saprospiraceae bacterium]
MTESTITTPTTTITITSSAMDQLKRIMQEQGVSSNDGLRVGVKGGGCSGFSYVLGFDERKDKDLSFVLEGMNVFIEKAQSMYLLGMEIDWLEGLDNRGFVFNNPNATENCGCGSSFSA